MRCRCQLNLAAARSLLARLLHEERMLGTEDLEVNEGKNQQEGRKDTKDHEKAQDQVEHQEVAQSQEELVPCHPGFLTWLGPQGRGVFGLADRRNTVQYQGYASSVEHGNKMARGKIPLSSTDRGAPLSDYLSIYLSIYIYIYG